MNRSTNGIGTTTVGSFPRPDDLVELLWAVESGAAVEEQALAARLGRAVSEVVAAQVGAGLTVVSDGEMSRLSFAGYVPQRLSGFEGADTSFLPQDLLEFGGLARRLWSDWQRLPRTPACTGPVSYRGGEQLARDIENLQAALLGARPTPGPLEGFLTATSPGNIALIYADQHYGDRETYLHAIALAMREEYRAITAAGLILQVDCPDLPMPRHLPACADMTPDAYRRYIWQSVEALNFALEGIDPEQVRVHLCWGNYRGPHHRDVPLGEIIDIVFAIGAGAFSIELANRRHAYEWTLFEDANMRRRLDGRLLIPGVIDTKTDTVEHPETVALELLRFARLLGRENVIAGTDCGLCTYASAPHLDPQVAWAKVAALVAGAGLASQGLWGQS